MKNRILAVIGAALAFGRDLITARDKVVPYEMTVPADSRGNRLSRATPRARAAHGPQRSERRVAMDLRDARKQRNRARNRAAHR